jgi:hypothetical protein
MTLINFLTLTKAEAAKERGFLGSVYRAWAQFLSWHDYPGDGFGGFSG